MSPADKHNRFVYLSDDPKGPYLLVDLTVARPGRAIRQQWNGYVPPVDRTWRYSLDRLMEFDREGRIVISKSGVPRLKRYLSELAKPEEEQPERTPLQHILASLTPLEAAVVSWRFQGETHTIRRSIEAIHELSAKFNLSIDQVHQIEHQALRKLHHAGRTAKLRDLGFAPDGTALNTSDEPTRITHAAEVIEAVCRLTPELLAHLRRHHEKLDQIPPEVFEQLVAEIFASWGWDEVRHVGRESETSADILAGHYDHKLGERLRYFVEVKRWRNRIGIEVINQVLGAMLDERPQFGWHAAMIVTLAGKKNLRKYSTEQLALKGVWVKDRTDVLSWLEGYSPSASGLWLPR